MPRDRRERRAGENDEPSDQSTSQPDRVECRTGQESRQPARAERGHPPFGMRQQEVGLGDATDHADRVWHQDGADTDQHTDPARVEPAETSEACQSDQCSADRQAECADPKCTPESGAENATERTGEIAGQQCQRQEQSQRQRDYRDEPAAILLAHHGERAAVVLLGAWAITTPRPARASGGGIRARGTWCPPRPPRSRDDESVATGTESWW